MKSSIYQVALAVQLTQSTRLICEKYRPFVSTSGFEEGAALAVVKSEKRSSAWFTYCSLSLKLKTRNLKPETS